MSPRDPRKRYNDFLSRKVLPTDGTERTLYVLLHGEKIFNQDLPLKPWDSKQVLDPTSYYAWEIFTNPGLKNIFEAFLFACPDDELIYESLGVNPDEISFYRTMLFDTTAFRNDLERISWIQTIPESEPHKEYFKMAFNQGFVALRWHYCRSKGEVTPEEAEQTVLTDSYVQYLSHRGKSLTNKTAKEARSLSKVIIDTVKTIRSKDTLSDMPGNADTIRFKFEQLRVTRTVEDLKGEGIEVLN
jgi:hypothetical protein